MDRREFITAGCTAASVAVAGLAGCTILGSDEEDDTVEMEVGNKWLRFEHKPAGNPEEFGIGWILDVRQDEIELHETVVQETDLTQDDVDVETKLGDLPMPEIATAFQRAEYGSLTRTYVWVQGKLQSQDEVNDIDPTEDDYFESAYLAPTEFFDPIVPGEIHRFRVARPGNYYPERRNGRLIDILE